MPKTALEAKRGNIFLIEPERLTLVTDRGSPLFDPRAEDAPDEAMVANVAMYGIIEPVVVRKNGEKIEVVAGRRRVAAALEANRRLAENGMKTMLVPVIIRGGEDADIFGVMISENEIRQDDSMVRKGEKCRKLLNLGYTVNSIAAVFGVTRQAVDNWLAADELPEPIRTAVEGGEVSATAAIKLSGFSREEQERRFEDLKDKDVKPTVQAVKTAAASAENVPLPRMRSQAEIAKKLKRRFFDGSVVVDGEDVGDEDETVDEGKNADNTDRYAQGYRAALRWVLGLD